MIARTPEPPYYAVIFTSVQTESTQGYESMARTMVELAASQPGFLGIESTRDLQGRGITVSFWDSEESIRAWQQNVRHVQAQQLGKSRWYADYYLRVAKVERGYGMLEAAGPGIGEEANQ